MIEALTTGLNGKILFGIAVLIVCVYLPYLFIYLRRRKTKQEIFERKNRDVVKVYHEPDGIGVLTVYSVNGKEPIPFYEMAWQGFYLLPGYNRIGVQYHYAKPSPFAVTGYENFNIEPRKIDVYVKKGKAYVLRYNIKSDKYELHENG